MAEGTDTPAPAFIRDTHRYDPLQPRIFAQAPPTARSAHRYKRGLFSSAFASTLDRVNTLGSDVDGHTGCVNALSWAEDGNLLISGGDDTTVRLWRMQGGEPGERFPFTCQSTIRTGHTANIFNAQMLPYTHKIATVAGDTQVRVFDVTTAPSGPEDGTYDVRDAPGTRVLKCHTKRTKRIVTEESEDVFLTVAEDGTVRQHDLRAAHRCRSGCPAPLVHLRTDLSTLALSPLSPWLFVVAGEASYGYLFDRRHAGRFIQQEWGVPPSDDATTCVRRFGRRTRGAGERRGYEHITGARMSSQNGHEVLLSYSSDAIYLYSTLDSPEDSSAHASGSGIVTPNTTHERAAKRRRIQSESPEPDWMPLPEVEMMYEDDDEDGGMESGFEMVSGGEGEREDGDASADEDEDSEEVEDEEEGTRLIDSSYEDVGVVLPRRRYTGHCNVQTVKDVNFLGPQDEYVVSGSDDGNWFMWRKSTGALCGIYEGDTSVVNVVEMHPHLPLIACSGIDTTVKIFAPVQRPSVASQMSKADTVIARNREAAEERLDLGAMYVRYQIALQAAVRRRQREAAGDAEEEDDEEGGCTFQ
ncbi:WD40 repeat-like protein [Peniophora sp. CONT]|nr:WD40 repeat-like protein [Peniophora sp. CONT]